MPAHTCRLEKCDDSRYHQADNAGANQIDDNGPFAGKRMSRMAFRIGFIENSTALGTDRA
jgi:hypothetical protein